MRLERKLFKAPVEEPYWSETIHNPNPNPHPRTCRRCDWSVGSPRLRWRHLTGQSLSTTLTLTLTLLHNPRICRRCDWSGGLRRVRWRNRTGLQPLPYPYPCPCPLQDLSTLRLERRLAKGPPELKPHWSKSVSDLGKLQDRFSLKLSYKKMKTAMREEEATRRLKHRSRCARLGAGVGLGLGLG